MTVAAKLINQDGSYVAAANPLPISGPDGVITSYAPAVTAGAYSAKDAVGELMEFEDAVRASGGKGKINTLVLTDLGVTANVLQLWLFTSEPGEIADNAAFDIADADLAKVVGVVPIAAADYFVATDNQVAVVDNVGIQFELAAGTTLYGQLMCTGTPTYASTADLTVRLAIEYLD